MAAPDSWTFTTGAAPDTVAPTVLSVHPVADETSVALDVDVTATFSEAMDPLSLTTATVLLQQGINNIDIAGKATFGSGSHFEGILLCKTEVTMQTGATMNGRVLAQTLVALQKATRSAAGLTPSRRRPPSAAPTAPATAAARRGRAETRRGCY